jgi:hypothetical protein
MENYSCREILTCKPFKHGSCSTLAYCREGQTTPNGSYNRTWPGYTPWICFPKNLWSIPFDGQWVESPWRYIHVTWCRRPGGWDQRYVDNSFNQNESTSQHLSPIARRIIVSERLTMVDIWYPIFQWQWQKERMRHRVTQVVISARYLEPKDQ